MNLAQGTFISVSGTDPNDGAKIVFVWCRDKGPEDYALLGSGHVVGAVGCPPGIMVGQYSVTFLLPPGCSADDVFVTDDKTGKKHLRGVTVTPCLGVPGFRSEATATPSERVGATNGSYQPATS
jgi:hypothetical protein